ncbi:MAG TPA: hypothetical protein ENK25_09595 [Bacteroidetes bacterium]|nr:hypothetical protein [Bacteroidota bacterium]
MLFSLLTSCTEKINYDLAKYREYESLKPEQKKEIYVEHFTDRSGIWPEDSLSYKICKIENGYYKLIARSYMQITQPTYQVKRSLLEIEVLVKQTENPDNLFFRIDLQSVFTLGISVQESQIGTQNSMSGQSVLNGINQFNNLTI